jgi:hypothetical protein
MAVNAVLIGARGTSSGSSVSTTAGTSAASGSSFCLVLSWDASQTVTAPVQDSKSNTYSAQGSAQADGNGGLLQAYTCENGSGGTSHNITINFSGVAFPTAHLLEITGASTTPVDKIAQTQDTSSPYTVTSPTLSQADEVVIGLCGANQGLPGSYSSSNFTILSEEPNSTNFWTSCAAKLVVSSTSAVTPSFTCSGRTGPAAVALVTFKQASAVGPTLMGRGIWIN